MFRKIGLTGLNAAGKGAAAEILMEFGYRYFSLSDILREEISREKLAPTRMNMIQIGNRMRAESGSGVLAERICLRLEDLSIIDSIRNPEEVRILRELNGFVLIAVEASPEMRFERMTARGRMGDAGTFDEFLAREALEQSDVATHQQLHTCLALADARIENSGSMDALKEQIVQICGLNGEG